MRDVDLQCKEKLIRQVRDSFISIKEMPALIAKQCPICNRSVQIWSRRGPDHFPAYAGVYRVVRGRGVASAGQGNWSVAAGSGPRSLPVPTAIPPPLGSLLATG